MGLRDARCSQFHSHTQTGRPAQCGLTARWNMAFKSLCIQNCSRIKQETIPMLLLVTQQPCNDELFHCHIPHELFHGTSNDWKSEMLSQSKRQQNNNVHYLLCTQKIHTCRNTTKQTHGFVLVFQSSINKCLHWHWAITIMSIILKFFFFFSFFKEQLQFLITLDPLPFSL